MKSLNVFYTILFSILLALISFFNPDDACAQLQPETIDTLYHAQVAPGIFHTEYEIRQVPWHLQVLRINRNSQQVEFRTVKANNQLTGLRTPMQMKTQLENDSVYVVGGVNGDFYGSGGVPVNAQVVNGTLLKRPFNRELIAFDHQFQPFIQTTSFSGSVSFGDTERTLNGINEARGGNHLTLYNRFMGSSTGTNEFGSEAGIGLVDSSLVNAPVRIIVEDLYPNQGNTDLSRHDLILSGHGTSAGFVESLTIGDTLTMELNLNPLERPVIEAIGGSTQFIKNGIVNSNWEERHPRTAVGFSADTSNIYFVVVDGRQSSSAGMMLSELGDFMVHIGADHAINLDGGGSSAMIVQDEVANNPSDGGLQRSVANALFVTTDNPGVGEIQGIQVRPGYKKLFLGKNLDLEVYTVDDNYRRDRVDNSEVQFTVDPSIGSVSSSGRFTASFESSSGYIYSEAEGYSDSTFIEILGVGELTLSPKEVTIDTTMEFSPMISIRDLDGLSQNLQMDRFEWSLTNPSVGSVDPQGVFTPAGPGNTGVVAAISEIADTMQITVQQKEGFNQVTSFSDPEFWNLTTENLDVNRVNMVAVDTGLELQFSYPPQDEQAKIILSGTLPTDGVPKFAHIETSGDGKDYILFVDIENPENGRYRMGPQRLANHTEPEVLEYIFDASWANRITPGASYYFPFSIEAFVLQLPKNNSGEDLEGVFRFHSAGVLYSETSVSTEEEPANMMPESIRLHQNFPNPFNPNTVISFEIPSATDVKLEVFDLLGRRVAQLVDDKRNAGLHQVSFNASNLASGVYLYQLKAGQLSLTNQMMLIK